jgi:serine/threonine-protein kinase
MVPGYGQERELGQGASGRVVSAVSVVTGQRVAIKYLAGRLLRDARFLAGFRAEAALLRSLDVPQVVRLLDYVEAPGQGAAIVMELIDGVSLRQLIARDGPAGPEPALAVLKGSLLGLAAAHAAGIVHRDYKPENVLVDGQGNSKLSDFGIAVREGRGAPAAGTPLYMAPEQWDGAAATPATDIYAACAVFYECLTGQAPFTGGIGQLRRLHTTQAVPAELVDEPLRPLIARGMAKDPAARPANALELVGELEATAAAAYGTDWESRGRGHLAARAAALLLLLLRAPMATTASGSSTSTTYTTLAAPKAAVKGAAKGAAKGAKAKGGLGLSGMQMAIAGTALVVAIAAGAATGWVAGKHHSAANAAPGPTRASAGAPASPSPGTSSAAALSSPACGSGPPPLAYVTQAGSALPLTTVVVRCGTGAPHAVATINGDSASNLTWSADSTQLAWLTSKTMNVAAVKAGAWALRSWPCQCIGLAFLGGQAVTVNGPTAGGPQQFVAAQPQLLKFPASGSGQPVTMPVTGIATIGQGSDFRLLGSVSPTGLVVAYGEAGGSNMGGYQILYHVNSAGQATQYGTGSLNQGTQPLNQPVGTFVDFTVNQAGSEALFSTYSQAGAMCPYLSAWVLDPASRTLIKPGTPAGGGPDGWLVQGVWFDRTGTAYASLVPNLGTCSTTTPPSGSPQPAGVAPIVVKLSGSNWMPAGRGVFRAAYGPGSWLAEKAGVTTQGLAGPAALTISDGTAVAPVTVPDVTSAALAYTDIFAWAPGLQVDAGAHDDGAVARELEVLGGVGRQAGGRQEQPLAPAVHARPVARVQVYRRQEVGDLPLR